MACVRHERAVRANQNLYIFNRGKSDKDDFELFWDYIAEDLQSVWSCLTQ